MHIPIMSRGSLILMMVAAAVTPLFVGATHTPNGSDKVRVEEQSAHSSSAFAVGSPNSSSAASSGERLNAYLETANELWNRTHDARAVRELLRVAEEDLAAAARPAAASPTPNVTNEPAAIPTAGAAVATAKTSPMVTTRTSPATTVDASPAAIAADPAAVSLPHLSPQTITIRASVHDLESTHLQRKLAAWRARFEMLSAAGPNLATAAILKGSDETDER